MMNPLTWGVGQQTPLAMNTQTELTRLAADTSNVSLAQLQGLAQAQGVMQAAIEEQPHIEIPRVNFFPSRHSNPRKARKKDIKQAYRLLKPTKRPWYSPLRWWFGGKYRYNRNTAQCCVDGCDVDYLLKVMGNVYDEIRDDETGRSLWEMYFVDGVSGESQAFLAREGVTGGRTMRATYCPEHLHLYHLLAKWEQEQEREQELTKGTLKDKVKKGVSVVAVPITAVASKDNTPPSLQKYEPFFRMLRADKIPVQHLKNAETGMNDITIIVFDQRQFAENRGGEPVLMTEGQVQGGDTTPVGAGLQQLLVETQNQLPEVD
tara:strand:+ start:2923 stop:3879 length:957 start_codon:yes stop_codon:yes gene_type:complete